MRLGELAGVDRVRATSCAIRPDAGDGGSRADLSASLQFNTDLFDATTIARMADCFHTLLTGVVVMPERPIPVLPVLTDAERQSLLTEWNSSRADYPTDWCIHHLFEERSGEAGPESTAVVHKNEHLSIQELNRRANQLAHHLRRLGVGPETRVAICVERSMEMVIGLMGVLKAGGAYVPLDPAYPTERLAYMLADSAPAVVLTNGAAVEVAGRLYRNAHLDLEG